VIGFVSETIDNALRLWDDLGVILQRSSLLIEG
jgi:hypothetical protein